jgi:hypothetical protein
MEEPCVAGAEAAHQIVHRQFELVRIFCRNDLFAPLLCFSRPFRPVVSGIKVLLCKFLSGLIEN